MIQTANDIGKAVTGAGIVAGGTYVVADWITRATEIATLASITATAFYFTAQFLYVVWKWYKECK